MEAVVAEPTTGETLSSLKDGGVAVRSRNVRHIDAVQSTVRVQQNIEALNAEGLVATDELVLQYALASSVTPGAANQSEPVDGVARTFAQPRVRDGFACQKGVSLEPGFTHSDERKKGIHEGVGDESGVKDTRVELVCEPAPERIVTGGQVSHGVEFRHVKSQCHTKDVCSDTPVTAPDVIREIAAGRRIGRKGTPTHEGVRVLTLIACEKTAKTTLIKNVHRVNEPRSAVRAKSTRLNGGCDNRGEPIEQHALDGKFKGDLTFVGDEEKLLARRGLMVADHARATPFQKRSIIGVGFKTSAEAINENVQEFRVFDLRGGCNSKW